MSGYFPSAETVNILMVEDSPTDQELIQLHLRKASSCFSVECEDTLASAIVRLDQNRPDVILLDLNLPDSDGIDTLHNVRKQTPTAPIVILSGQHDDELAIEAVSQGAQDYIPKNEINPDVLSRSIRYAIERSRRQWAEGELRVAGEIQQSLLPRSAPELPGYDIAGRCDPADYAGGDYYDFLSMPDDKLGLVIADVSGHGVPAAMIMSELRAVLRTLIRSDSDKSVGQIATQLNEILSADLSAERFVTFFFACFDPAARNLHYACAGHPAYVLSKDGKFEYYDSNDPPLGVHADHSFEDKFLSLEEGDMLTLFTDGITECYKDNMELYGVQRLMELLHAQRQESSEVILDNLFVEAAAFADDDLQNDDMTAILVKVL